LSFWKFPLLDILTTNFTFPVLDWLSRALKAWTFPILDWLQTKIENYKFPILDFLQTGVWDFPIINIFQKPLSDFPILYALLGKPAVEKGGNGGGIGGGGGGGNFHVHQWVTHQTSKATWSECSICHAVVAPGTGTWAGYQGGTSYVPQTGTYMLHKGEAVIPASQNSSGGRAVNVTVNVNASIGSTYDVKRLCQEIGFELENALRVA
jgi:hypothetical protein